MTTRKEIVESNKYCLRVEEGHHVQDGIDRDGNHCHDGTETGVGTFLAEDDAVASGQTRSRTFCIQKDANVFHEKAPIDCDAEHDYDDSNEDNTCHEQGSREHEEDSCSPKSSCLHNEADTYFESYISLPASAENESDEEEELQSEDNGVIDGACCHSHAQGKKSGLRTFRRDVENNNTIPDGIDDSSNKLVANELILSYDTLRRHVVKQRQSMNNEAYGPATTCLPYQSRRLLHRRGRSAINVSVINYCVDLMDTLKSGKQQQQLGFHRSIESIVVHESFLRELNSQLRRLLIRRISSLPNLRVFRIHDDFHHCSSAYAHHQDDDDDDIEDSDGATVFHYGLYTPLLQQRRRGVSKTLLFGCNLDEVHLSNIRFDDATELHNFACSLSAVVRSLTTLKLHNIVINYSNWTLDMDPLFDAISNAKNSNGIDITSSSRLQCLEISSRGRNRLWSYFSYGSLDRFLRSPCGRSIKKLYLVATMNNTHCETMRRCLLVMSHRTASLQSLRLEGSMDLDDAGRRCILSLVRENPSLTSFHMDSVTTTLSLPDPYAHHGYYSSYDDSESDEDDGDDDSHNHNHNHRLPLIENQGPSSQQQAQVQGNGYFGKGPRGEIKFWMRLNQVGRRHFHYQSTADNRSKCIEALCRCVPEVVRNAGRDGDAITSRNDDNDRDKLGHLDSVYVLIRMRPDLCVMSKQEHMECNKRQRQQRKLRSRGKNELHRLPEEDLLNNDMGLHHRSFLNDSIVDCAAVIANEREEQRQASKPFCRKEGSTAVTLELSSCKRRGNNSPQGREQEQQPPSRGKSQPEQEARERASKRRKRHHH